jgi:predicted DNA-binding transcriptional regulator AlpA
MTRVTITKKIDLGGIITAREMAAIMGITVETLRRRVHADTFPIPVIDTADRRYRWWGPTVQRWLDEHMPSDGRVRGASAADDDPATLAAAEVRP